jgi:hypothetical protein
VKVDISTGNFREHGIWIFVAITHKEIVLIIRSKVTAIGTIEADSTG